MKVGLQSLSRTLRERWQRRSQANHAVGVVASTRNGTLVLDPDDANVSLHLLNKGEYDWPEVTLLSRLVGATSRLVFVGAHIGALLIPIVRASGTRTVLAYEASPRNYQMLQMNLALNGIAGVATENIAVGDRPGRKRFAENRFEIGIGRVVKERTEVEVTIHTLDAALPRDWTSIDLMVMGIAGFEASAIRGVSRSLPRIQNLYVELPPEQLYAEGIPVEDLIAPAANHFRSAYVIGGRTNFVPSRELRAFLRTLPRKRGEVLKMLFTKDVAARPELAPAT